MHTVCKVIQECWRSQAAPNNPHRSETVNSVLRDFFSLLCQAIMLSVRVSHIIFTLLTIQCNLEINSQLSQVLHASAPLI